VWDRARARPRNRTKPRALDCTDRECAYRGLSFRGAPSLGYLPNNENQAAPNTEPAIGSHPIRERNVKLLAQAFQGVSQGGFALAGDEGARGGGRESALESPGQLWEAALSLVSGEGIATASSTSTGTSMG
jgi:hypothetical protein